MASFEDNQRLISLLAQPHNMSYQALEERFTNYMLNCIVAHAY